MRSLTAAYSVAVVASCGLAIDVNAQDGPTRNRRPDLPGLHHESVAFDVGRERLVVVFDEVGHKQGRYWSVQWMERLL